MILGSLFLDILKKAEKEVDFYTEGYKLLIEAFSTSEDILVFTITKYQPKNVTTSINNPKKKITVKKKYSKKANLNRIYSFNDFDTFCNFCSYIKNVSKFDLKKLSNNISLYLYNNTYYLFIKNINKNYEFLHNFYLAILEFATPCSFSSNFENKLVEHGKIIMKKNAINMGIKYFSA